MNNSNPNSTKGVNLFNECCENAATHKECIESCISSYDEIGRYSPEAIKADEKYIKCSRMKASLKDGKAEFFKAYVENPRDPFDSFFAGYLKARNTHQSLINNSDPKKSEQVKFDASLEAISDKIITPGSDIVCSQAYSMRRCIESAECQTIYKKNGAPEEFLSKDKLNKILSDCSLRKKV